MPVFGVLKNVAVSRELKARGFVGIESEDPTCSLKPPFPKNTAVIGRLRH